MFRYRTGFALLCAGCLVSPRPAGAADYPRRPHAFPSTSSPRSASGRRSCPRRRFRPS